MKTMKRRLISLVFCTFMYHKIIIDKKNSSKSGDLESNTTCDSRPKLRLELKPLDLSYMNYKATRIKVVTNLWFRFPRRLVDARQL